MNNSKTHKRSIERKKSSNLISDKKQTLYLEALKEASSHSALSQKGMGVTSLGNFRMVSSKVEFE